MGWRDRRRTLAAALLATLCLTFGGLPPAATRLLLPPNEPVAPTDAKPSVGMQERGCVLLPVQWDPHLDWNAGPPC